MSEDRLLTLGYEIVHMHGVKVLLPPLVLIPGGHFLLGSDPAEDPESYDDEQPQHQIIIHDFYLAKYPVTVAEYQCAVDAGAVSIPEPQVMSFGTASAGLEHHQPNFLTWEEQQAHPDFPVRALKNWFEAYRYTQWLAALTGQSWRLSTEAEWERAAKGTDHRRYPWGNEWEPERVQSRLNQEKIWGIGPVGTHPQGASPYGVEDLAGNVSEWTSSLYRAYPYNPLDGREDPLIQGEYVVSKGGSWLSDPDQMRTTYRDDDGNWVNGGFRLACSSGEFNKFEPAREEKT
ncbi:MAG TPA: SUMF1/EgtB/PvdO family nonheme iron enzyme [Ktedonobacteraceae bacterium]|nr:SUMF1/EgtB/PvdO family nonheme iron enzyme [Ktedonobacteraceae bacterium]